MSPISSAVRSPTLYRCSSSSSISSTSSVYIPPSQSGPTTNGTAIFPVHQGHSDSSDDNRRPKPPIGRKTGGVPGKGDSEGISIRMSADVLTEAPPSAKLTPTAKVASAKASQRRAPASEPDSPQYVYRLSPAPVHDPSRHATGCNDSMATKISTSPSVPALHRRPSAPSTPWQKSHHNRPHHRSTSTSSNASSPRKGNSRTTTPLAPPEVVQSIKSPPKRPRTENCGPKILPALYQHCDTKDLAVLIADMLQELVGLNDKLPLSNSGLTRFHSRATPTISIPDYLARLTLHSSLQPSILLSMVYYIDILSTLYPAFTITSLTVHRFLITAATVASKGLCDSFLTNSFYAKVGGVSLLELNLLELEFLTRVGWRIVPKGEVLAEYYRSLVGRLSSRYKIEEDPVSPAISPLITPKSAALNESTSRRQSKVSIVSASATPVIDAKTQTGEQETSGMSGNEGKNSAESSAKIAEDTETGEKGETSDKSPQTSANSS